MVMKQEIKEIYNRLSGGKNIDGDAYVITQGQFSSVLLDRFVAELNKVGVKWDRKDIAFGELLGGQPAGAIDENQERPPVNVPNAAFAPESVSSKSADFAVGIDIQHIAE